MQNSKSALKSQILPEVYLSTREITIQVVYLPEQVLRYYLSTPVPNSGKPR